GAGADRTAPDQEGRAGGSLEPDGILPDGDPPRGGRPGTVARWQDPIRDRGAGRPDRGGPARLRVADGPRVSVRLGGVRQAVPGAASGRGAAGTATRPLQAVVRPGRPGERPRDGPRGDGQRRSRDGAVPGGSGQPGAAGPGSVRPARGPAAGAGQGPAGEP